MIKTRLYLVRHGNTLWNTQKRYQGWTDIDLSEEGRVQAELVGERFKEIEVDRVISSPLKRAVDTAEPIARARGLEVELDEHFKEINFGEWEGMNAKELISKYGDGYMNFFRDPFKYPCPGEGTFADVSVRVSEGIDNIFDKNKGGQVAIVSHGGVLRLLIIYLLKLPGEFYSKSWLDNTSISIIDIYENGNIILLGLNDKSHLLNKKDE